MLNSQRDFCSTTHSIIYCTLYKIFLGLYDCCHSYLCFLIYKWLLIKRKGESHVRFRTLGECPLEGHLSCAVGIVRQDGQFLSLPPLTSPVLPHGTHLLLGGQWANIPTMIRGFNSNHRCFAQQSSALTTWPLAHLVIGIVCLFR